MIKISGPLTGAVSMSEQSNYHPPASIAISNKTAGASAKTKCPKPLDGRVKEAFRGYRQAVLASKGMGAYYLLDPR
jgi:septal ring factor EnvC (AmiA/AmiB activator)